MAEVELFEPAEYLDQRGPGYFSIAGKPNGVWKQRQHELSLLPKVIDTLNPALDTWISQATFRTGANRQTVNVQSIGLFFSDLDTYNEPDLVRCDPAEQCRRLLAFCRDSGLPEPSIVLFSGRGLQAKWLLSGAIDGADLMSWNRVQAALVDRLSQFGADPKAKDVVRVLRVDRTVNTKSGEVVRVLHVTGGVEAAPARYDFAEMHKILCPPLALVKPNPQQTPRITTSSGFGLRQLNWSRMHDLLKLNDMRGQVEGYRELTLFYAINFLLLAEPHRVSQMWHEARALASRISPDTFYHQSDLSTVYRKAREGRSALYTPTNDTLLTLFEMTPEEERLMATIISQEERVRRQREKRWAAGTKPQPFGHTRPWESLGISRMHFYRLGLNKGLDTQTLQDNAQTVTSPVIEALHEG